MLNKMNKIFQLLCSSLLLAAISGCSGLPFLSASFKSTDSFIISDNNPNVRYKGDNKEYANNIGSITPDLISMVEEKIGVGFLKSPIIYICDTWKCMEEYTGHKYKPRASANKRGIFISIKLAGKTEETKFLLPHELTHALWADKVNSFSHPIPPAWFAEGLATFIADGAGAEKCSRVEAIRSIKDGKYFIPNSDGKMFSRMYGNKWNLEQRMFYRQSMMFIEYMDAINPESFRMLVKDVFSKQIKFSVLFYKYYGSTPSELWEEYVEKIRTT